MSQMRKERDSLGEIEVPADKLVGRTDAALDPILQHRQRT